MYPFHQKERKEGEIFHWDNYTVGSTLDGRVVKFSDYGAYVDVGAPVLAFMHRHKMLSNRKQRKLKSWEIYPLGTDIKAFVYQIDPQRKRIEITTFPEEVWDWRFPRPHEKQIQKDNDGEDDEYDDDEENPDGNDYSSRKDSAMFGLEKELEEDDDDEKGEILTSEEVRKLTGKRLLIDDFTNEEDDGSEGKKKSNSQTKKKKTDSLLSSFTKDEEITPSELFTELTNGHYYLTLNHLKKWYYIQTFLEEGHLSNDQLRRIFRDAGGFRGRLNEEQFENFLEMFQDELGLHEEDEVEIDDEGNVIVPEDDEEEEYEYVDEDEEGDESQSILAKQEEAKRKAKEEEEDRMMDLIESDLNYFGKHFEKFVNSDEEDTLQSFQQSSSTTTSTTNQKTSSKTISPKKSLFRRKNKEEDVEENLQEVQDIKRVTLPPASAKVMNVINPQPTNTIYENILATSFNDLRKRSEGVNVDDVLRWKLTKSMIADKVIVENEVREIFQKMTDGRSMMNFQQFQRFSDELRVLDLGRAAAPTTPSKTSPPAITKKLPSNTPYNPKKTTPKRTLTPSFQPTEAPVAAPSYQRIPSRLSEIPSEDDLSPSVSTISTSPSLHSNFLTTASKDEDEDDSVLDNAEDDSNEEKVEDEEEEDDEEFFLKVMQESEEKDEKELIESMFQGFANGKPYVKASALLEWDLVFNLIGAVSMITMRRYTVCSFSDLSLIGNFN